MTARPLQGPRPLFLCTCLCLLLSAASGRPHRHRHRPDVLLPAPVNPTEPGPDDSGGGDAGPAAALPTVFAKWVNITSRSAVKALYNQTFMLTGGRLNNIGFSATQCLQGTLPTNYITAMLRRINFYRSLAGVPCNVTHNAVFGSKAQQAALMLIVNGELNHFPPTSWKCYKKGGAEAAGSSNLSLGTSGPASVDSQMRERQASNFDASHRRWLLYPTTPRMGVGSTDFEKNNYHGASAIWVVDSATFFNPRPKTRSSYVAWPPAGFVPYQTVWARWSFSYPGADFSAAKVSLMQGTKALGVTLEPVSDGSGDNTLVWLANTQNSSYNEDRDAPWDKPTGVQKITVKITGVKVPGSALLEAFSYLVQIFDPAV